MRRAAALVAAALLGASSLTALPGGRVADAQVPPNELISVSTADNLDVVDNIAPSISGAGDVVAFTSFTLGGHVRDRGEPAAARIDTSSVIPVALSRDGCFVVYEADNQVWRRHRCDAGADDLVADPVGEVLRLAVSSSGRFVAYSEFTDSTRYQVIVRDMSPPVGRPGQVAMPLATGGYSGSDEPVLSDDTGGQVFLGFVRGEFVVPTPGWRYEQAIDRPRVHAYRWSSQDWPAAGNEPVVVPVSTLTLVSSEAGIDGDDVYAASALSMSADGEAFAYRFRHNGAISNRIRTLERAAPQPFPDPLADLAANGSTDATTTSWSQDATQLAYSRQSDRCPGCREVAVARSTGGFFDSVSTDAVAIDPAFTIGNGGRLFDPALSSTGRAVAFAADPGRAADAASGRATQHIYVRNRLPQPSLEAIDFGEVTVGDATTRTSTLANTGLSSFEVDALAADGDFAVVGDDCGGAVGAGASCTVTVRFSPSASGARTGALTASEALAPLLQPTSATASLAGAGVSPDPGTTTSTTADGGDSATTATTPPAGGTTTTTGSTAPGDGLTITPSSVSFARTTIGATSGAENFTVRNTGSQSNTVADVVLSGVGSGDFTISADLCGGRTLDAGATCSVGAQFRPNAPGLRAAALVVRGQRSTSVTAELSGDATADPTLVPSPAVVRGGTVTMATGLSFPPTTTVTLVVDGHRDPLVVVTDERGGFRVPIVVLSGERPGPRIVTALGQPGLFEEVRAPFLVVLSTYAPQSGTGPAFGDSALLSRG